MEWENLIPLNCKIFGFTSAEVISSIMEQLEMCNFFLPLDIENLLPPGHPVMARQLLKGLGGYQAWTFSDRDDVAQSEEITMQ